MDERKPLKDKYADILCGLLADRLPLSLTWRNVSFEVNKDEYEIRWFDSKDQHDPEGKRLFRSHKGPYTSDGLHLENENQEEKYENDLLI